MTIIVTVKVTDGIVLAADSAASFFMPGASVPLKIYNHANKIFNLVKVWPVGALVYGAGSIGAASVETLSKDLRKRLSDPDDAEYGLAENRYTIEEVAIKARKFLYEQNFLTAYPAPPPNFLMGYRVCGYSAGADLSEIWEFFINGSNCAAPYKVQAPDEFGLRWAGESEALDRLLLGASSSIKDWLVSKNLVPSSNVETAYGEIVGYCGTPVVMPAMPIQDAVDVARFAVDTASKFAKYGLRPETIGGPIEVAPITKHEGFKWISRKHYYPMELNRETNHGR